MLFVSATTLMAEEDVAVIADFNSGEWTNNLGGNIEVWLKDNGSDESQNCHLTFVEDDVHSLSTGYAIQIDYDVDSPNPAYNGIRTSLKGFDASGFTSLNFFIKGDSERGFSEKLKIEMIGANKRPSPYMVNGITDRWQKISVPLSEFFIVKDWSTVEYFVIVFADITNDPKVGAFYLDHVYFAKE